MSLVFFDSETIGLHGFMVLLQYAKDDGDIKIHEVWREPIGDTLDLLEEIASNNICGFNLSFDWFHVSKVFTTFSVLRDEHGPDFIPELDIDTVAIAEERARDYPYCLKPKSACDLLLWAQKGKYQKLMRRKPIVIRKVPTQLATMVQQELEQKIQFDDVFFSQRSNPKSERWVIKDVKLPNGEMNPAFKNIELTFNPSTKLKVLAQYALGIETDLILKFVDIEVPKSVWPKEYGFAPFACAVGRPGKWNMAWPEVATHHISHWRFNQLARTYAKNDVEYTRQLHEHLDSPEPGDTDSELACMVGAVRWRGFVVNLENLKKLRDEEQLKLEKVPTAPNAVKAYLAEVMTPTQQLGLRAGTGEEILKSLLEWDDARVVERAQNVLSARYATKEIELYDKLLKSQKFHPSFKVIGALSTRMSGSDKLNPQGIKSTEKVRENFDLKRPGFILCGGDFDAFEVSIAEAVYNDENLRADILSGKSPHGLFASELYPHLTYEEITATKKTENDLYSKGKTGFFRLMYGGNWEGMVKPLDVKPEVAERAFTTFLQKYPGIKRHRDSITDQFCSMTQPAGIGTAVIWKEPADYVDNGLGFKRYFTLENSICKALFELAQAPPKKWTYIKSRVTRKDRQQTACGATQSALYAAAFNIQAHNLRAAANHQIQSKGATITKELQRRIWDEQPSGVHKWLVQNFNVHDEIMCCTDPSVVDKIKTTVEAFIQQYKAVVPLLGMKWKVDMENWSKK